MLFVFGNAPAHAATFFVDSLEDNTTADSQLTLREAITAANATVPQGGEVNRIDFFVVGTITLNGTPLPDITREVDINGFEIIIDGNGQSRIFRIRTPGSGSGVLADVRLSGLTLRNGRASGAAPLDQGGAIYHESGRLDISDCVLSGNVAVSGGGAIFSNDSLSISRSTITGNSVSDTNSEFKGGGLLGGATIRDSTVSGNSAPQGGGIFSSSSVTVFRSTIAGNTASEVGGGIANIGGSLSINDSTLSGNTVSAGAGNGGGAIYSDTNPDFTSNSTGLINSTLSGNSAPQGGGIGNYNGLVTLDSVTVTNNSASLANGGGGIVSYGDSETSTRVGNSIVAGNADGDVVFILEPVNSFASTGTNLIGTGNGSGAFTGTGDQTGVTNPRLGPLVDNGGPTLTHTLLAGSPAIDAGATTLSRDQRNLDRPFGAADDIGALELNSTPPANTPPTVSDLAISVAEDATFAFAEDSFDASFNDANAGDSLQTLSIVTLPTNGTLLFNGVAATVNQQIARADIDLLSYVPAANFNGADGFDYNASDGALFAANNARVNITVTPVNDAPVALDQSVATDEDVALSITLTATDIDGDTPTYSIITGPTNGTLAGTAPNLTYTPNGNFSGADSFTFRAGDGTVDSNIATIGITVNAINDAPIGVADGYSTDINAPLNVAAPGVLGNDTDAEGAALTAALVDNVTNGTLTLNADGSFSYVPNTDFSGVDSFTYTASDGTLVSAATTVTITVNAGENIGFGVSVTPKAPMTNDVLTATPIIADASGVSFAYQWSVGGVERPNETGATYDLSVAGNGDKGDKVSVVVTATRGIDSGAATNFVDVFNSAPTAANATASGNAGTLISVPVAGADADGDAITFKRVGGPTNGTGSFVTDAGGVTTFNYTSRAFFNGVESIRFVALDSEGKPSQVATISITVSAPARPIGFGVSLLPFGPRTDTVLMARPLLGNDAGVTFAYVWSVNGTVRPGETEQTLDLGKPGNGDRGDTVSVVVTATRGIDSGSATNSALVVNSAPVANDASASGDAEQQIIVPVTGSDADGDALTFKRVGGPTNGTGSFVTDANGQTSFVYRSRARFNGTETIRFVAIEAGGRSSVPATISIAVTSDEPAIGFGVTLTPFGPKTNDTLTASLVISSTANTTFSYAWSVNGVVRPGETTNKLDLSKPGNGDRGDTVTAIVTATRGASVSTSRNSATVGNSAPTTQNASASGISGSEIVVPVVGSDVDRDALTFKRVGGPRDGTGSFVTDANGNTAFVYRSRAGFVGTEEIRFVAVDPLNRTSVPATISINVVASGAASVSSASALRVAPAPSGGAS